MERVVTILVRLLGMAVLVVGIGAGVLVIYEAWQLYREPQRIDRFAVAIEQGSNLDRFVGPVIEGSGLVLAESDDPEDLAATASSPATPSRSSASAGTSPRPGTSSGPRRPSSWTTT